MDINEDCIRRRAYRMWEAEGRPVGQFDEYWRWARSEIETELMRASQHLGDMDHRLPMHVEEALVLEVSVSHCLRGG